MAKRKTLKLPNDFLGTVQAFLQSPAPKKKATRKRPKKKAVGARKA